MQLKLDAAISENKRNALELRAERDPTLDDLVTLQWLRDEAERLTNELNVEIQCRQRRSVCNRTKLRKSVRYVTITHSLSLSGRIRAPPHHPQLFPRLVRNLDISVIIRNRLHSGRSYSTQDEEVLFLTLSMEEKDTRSHELIGKSFRHIRFYSEEHI